MAAGTVSNTAQNASDVENKTRGGCRHEPVVHTKTSCYKNAGVGAQGIRNDSHDEKDDGHGFQLRAAVDNGSSSQQVFLVHGCCNNERRWASWAHVYVSCVAPMLESILFGLLGGQEGSVQW